jgi:hypothetical protein
MTPLLVREDVGLLECGEHAYQVFYGNVMLATGSLHDKEVRVERVKCSGLVSVFLNRRSGYSCTPSWNERSSARSVATQLPVSDRAVGILDQTMANEQGVTRHQPPDVVDRRSGPM